MEHLLLCLELLTGIALVSLDLSSFALNTLKRFIALVEILCFKTMCAPCSKPVYDICSSSFQSIVTYTGTVGKLRNRKSKTGGYL